MTPGFLQRTHYLRGLSAFAVMCSHVAHWNVAKLGEVAESPMVQIGTYCVSIFFCLSGFIMVNNHAADFGKPQALRSYALKRAFRIYPAYLFYSLATFVLVGVLGVVSWDRQAMEIHSISEAVSATALVPFSTHSHAYLTVGWSLFHEMLFYIVFAVLIVSRPLGMLACAAFFAISSVNGPGVLVPINSLTKLNLLFLAGMAIAWMQPRLPCSRVLGWGIICAGLAAFGVALAKSLTNYSTPVFAGAVLLLWGVVLLDTHFPLARGQGGIAGHALNWLGTLSYSLYLGHALAQALVYAWLGKPGNVWIVTVYMAFPLLLAWSTWLWVERPSQRVVRSLLKRGGARASDSAVSSRG